MRNTASKTKDTDIIFDSIQAIIERLNIMESKLDRIWDTVNNLSSYTISETPPETTNDEQIVLSSAEEDDAPLQKKEFNKAEVCMVIAELKDSKDMTWVEIVQELKAMGYTPQDENKDYFHHLAVSNYYKYAKKHLLTESGSDGVEEQNKFVPDAPQTPEFKDEPVESEQIIDDTVDAASTAQDQVIETNDMLDTAEEIPDIQNKDEYREYTLNLIIELKNADMTLKEIVDKLYEMGVKTRTGKDKWSIGTIGNILKKEKR